MILLTGGGRAWFYSGGMRGFFSFFGYNQIRSMSGRYASYWNAFLFLFTSITYLTYNIFRMHLHLPSRYFDPVLSGLLRIVLPYFGISFNWKINTNVPMKYCNYSFCYYNPMKHGKSGLGCKKKIINWSH